jgi:hypothetical protein
MVFCSVLPSFCTFMLHCGNPSMQVRSLTLDVKVWDPSILNLFQSLGNYCANTIWEELLHPTSSTSDEALRSVMQKFDML